MLNISVYLLRICDVDLSGETCAACSFSLCL